MVALESKKSVPISESVHFHFDMVQCSLAELWTLHPINDKVKADIGVNVPVSLRPVAANSVDNGGTLWKLCPVNPIR